MGERGSGFGESSARREVGKRGGEGGNVMAKKSPKDR